MLQTEAHCSLKFQFISLYIIKFMLKESQHRRKYKADKSSKVINHVSMEMQASS
jgi:hypothetical protein